MVFNSAPGGSGPAEQVSLVPLHFALLWGVVVVGPS
jgi:hypothetical protein